MKETDKKHLLIGIIAIISVVILSIVSFFLFSKDNKEEDKNNIANFKIENTCWSFDNNTDILCFGDGKVYSVIEYNNQYRKTEHTDDTYTVVKTTETEGKLISDSFDDLLISYIIKEEDNKLILWTTYYDDILEEIVENEYELMKIKNDEIKVTKEFVVFNIMNNEFKQEISNIYLSVYYNIPLHMMASEYEKEIKTKDGKNSYNLGYRIKYLGEKGGYAYYTTEENANYAIKNNLYQFISDHKLCYTTEYVKNEKDFTKKLDKRTRQVIIHYCDYLKENDVKVTTTSNITSTTTSNTTSATIKKDSKTTSKKETNKPITSSTTKNTTTINKEVAERNSINKIVVELKKYDDESFKVYITNPDNVDVTLYIDGKEYDMDEELIFYYEESGENCIKVKLKGTSTYTTSEKCINFTPKKINYELTTTNSASGCVLHIANKDLNSPYYNELKNTTCDLKHRTMSCHKLERELLSPGTYQITAKNEFGGQQIINVTCE